MIVKVTEWERIPVVTGPTRWAALSFDVILTSAEASTLRARNAEIGTWLRPAQGGFLLMADGSTLRELGMGDIDDQIERDAERQANRRTRTR